MTDRIVFIHLAGATRAVPAGQLTLVEQGVQLQASRFAYGRRYRDRSDALPVDPASLPLAVPGGSEWQVPVNGLVGFGALRDATPDAWGRRVIENRRRAPPNSLPESVYLDEAGPNRAGALDVRATPTSEPADGALPGLMDLAHLVEAAERVEAGLPVPAHLEVLFAGAPSVGGARPKAVVVADGRQWIAKFPSHGDSFDVPAVERATLELAREAGLDVPATRLERLADGRAVMLVERFDRVRVARGFARRHMVSALTLLGVHEHDSPASSYAAMVEALAVQGVQGSIDDDRRELFGRMVFNILVSNDDDHLRNHAFLCDPGARGWRLSPLYDVVPKPQVAQERFLHLSVGPQGRAARLDNAMASAGRFGLLPQAAATIADRVMRVVRRWREVFEANEVATAQCDRIASAFRRGHDVGAEAVERLL